MMEQATLEKGMKKFRTLTFALIFSGALNIGLLATLLFSSPQEKKHFPPTPPKERREELSNRSLLAAMSKLSFRELLSYLTNKEPLEEGYTKRDLALAALVAYHYFPLEKALSSPLPQRRVLSLGEQQIELFPGLGEEQFQAVVKFAYEEKWPLTSEGLFHLLKKAPKPRDESLVQAFLVTPEFYHLQLLFQKALPLDPSLLIDLLVEGNWETLSRFSKEQAQVSDFSVERRQKLLLEYLSLHAQTAARLLLATDFSFARQRLDDLQVLDLLRALSEGSSEARRYCAELLSSPRTDAVRHLAAEKLYLFQGEALPVPFELKAALARFSPEGVAPKETPSQQPILRTEALSPSTRFHVVAQGENLWKIAKRYKVKLADLIAVNGLEKDQLYPGITLKIPSSPIAQGTGS